MTSSLKYKRFLNQARIKHLEFVKQLKLIRITLNKNHDLTKIVNISIYLYNKTRNKYNNYKNEYNKKELKELVNYIKNSIHTATNKHNESLQYKIRTVRTTNLN